MIEEAALLASYSCASPLSSLSSVLSFFPSSHPLPQRARAFPSDVAAAAAPPLPTAQCLLGNYGSLGSAQNANLEKPKLKGEESQMIPYLIL